LYSRYAYGGGGYGYAPGYNYGSGYGLGYGAGYGGYGSGYGLDAQYYGGYPYGYGYGNAGPAYVTPPTSGYYPEPVINNEPAVLSRSAPVINRFYQPENQSATSPTLADPAFADPTLAEANEVPAELVESSATGTVPDGAQSVLNPMFDAAEGEAINQQGEIAPGMVLPDGSTVISVGTP